MAEKLYTCYETSQTMNQKDWFLYYLTSDEIDKKEYKDFSDWWHDMRKSGVIEVAWNNYFKEDFTMKVKTIKQGNYNFLSVNNQMVCCFNEAKNQFIRCTTVGITEKVIECINDFRALYHLKPITLDFFMNEFCA